MITVRIHRFNQNHTKHSHTARGNMMAYSGQCDNGSALLKIYI